MKTTTYAGINYAGHTNANRDAQTLIRYGVIHSNAINPDAFSDIQDNGTDEDYAAFVSEIKSRIRSAIESFMPSSRIEDNVESAFEAISDEIDYDSSGDCTRYSYNKDGYELQTMSDGDIFISKSKFFTYAQFCSPCAPGACYLLNPLEHEEFTVTENDVIEGNNVHPDTNERLPVGTYSAKPSNDNRAYCFGHDWFEDGVAPYPVYSVETGELVSN